MHPNKGMEAAFKAAQQAFQQDEVPVGAALLDADGQIIAIEHNRTKELQDPTAHAELLALKKGFAFRQQPYLEDCTLYVTLEPCAMCAQAISYARVKAVYFGAYDTKSGGVVNGARVLNHAHFKPEIYGGTMEEECSKLLKEFFESKR